MIFYRRMDGKRAFDRETGLGGPKPVRAVIET